MNKSEWYVECANPHDQLLAEFAQKKLLQYLVAYPPPDCDGFLIHDDAYLEQFKGMYDELIGGRK